MVAGVAQHWWPLPGEVGQWHLHQRHSHPAKAIFSEPAARRPVTLHPPSL